MKTNIFVLAAIAVLLGLSLPQNVSAKNIKYELTAENENQITYVEIKATEIPEEIGVTIAREYPGFAIEKSMKGNNGTYKMVISEDNIKKVLIFDKHEKLIRAKESSSQPEYEISYSYRLKMA